MKEASSFLACSSFKSWKVASTINPASCAHFVKILFVIGKIINSKQQQKAQQINLSFTKENLVTEIILFMLEKKKLPPMSQHHTIQLIRVRSQFLQIQHQDQKLSSKVSRELLFHQSNFLLKIMKKNFLKVGHSGVKILMRKYLRNIQTR